MNHQLFLPNIWHFNEIIDLILIETTSNIDYYVSFLVQGTRATLLSQMKMYLYEKTYDTPYGDMLPLVLCNALRLNLIISSQSASGYDIRKVITGSSDYSDMCVFVHKYEDHYDGITIKAKTSNVNNADQTRELSICSPSTFDSNLPLVADQSTNVAGVLNSVSSGDFMNCDTLDTTSSTSSSEHKSHDASLCDMNKSVTDLSGINDDGGPVVDYIYHLKRYRTENPKNCIIGHLNINSIRNKFEAVECILNDGLIDIFALSESKIDESFPNAQFIINDFSLHRKDRNRFGGGLLLYIRSDIPHRRRCDLEPRNQISHGVEIMVIEARLYKMEKWFLVIIYKPPKVTNESFENTLTEICQSLEKESTHWFVMGDTNLDMNHEKSLSDPCVVYNLSNLVDGPTCFKGDKPSSIDVLLSTEPKRFKTPLNSTCSLSDFHNLTCVATKLHKPHIAPKTIYYRSYRNFDDDIFLNDVQNIPFWVGDIFEDEDDRLWSFSKMFSDIIDKNAPIKKKTLKKPSLPYMNSSLRRAIHKKNMLYNSYRKGKVPWETYRKQRNLTTAINKQSKATYFRERCDGGPKKQKFWTTIRPFITDKNAFHCNKITLQEGDKIITDTQEICEIFNAFFTSVANNIGFDDTIPPDYYTDEGFSSIIKRHCNHPSIIKIKENNAYSDMFHFQCINHADVVKIINDFDSKKAQGYDRMPMKMLQKSAKYIASAIAKIINDSMSNCVFPDSLKLAEVSSLFKKKDALIKTNYRPVSILVALSKIYEKAVGVQLTGYFNSIFSTLLSAFRKGYSCQSALLNMIENFKRALDKGEYVACISMDISKAFDCLPHCLTICKLFAYGLSRDACTLTASYLSRRKQRVKIGNIKSEWGKLIKVCHKAPY